MTEPSLPQQPLPQSLGQQADDGLPDPQLEAALLAWAHAAGGESTDQAAEQDYRRKVVEAFRQARVYVPAVSPEGDQVGMIALRREDGLTAIPVFTSIERLVAWKPDARPLPHIGSVLSAMANDDGYAVAILDIDGPVTATLPVDVLLTD